MSGTYLSKIPVLVVALVIGIVLVTSAVVPLASDYSEAKTFKNDGYFTYDAVKDDTDVTFTWAPSDPKKLSFGDDKVVDFTDLGKVSLTIIGSDNFTCRYYCSDSVAGGLQTYGVGGYKSYNPDNETAAVTITVDASALAFDGTTDKSYTMGNRGFVINPDGTGLLTLKYPNESAYVMDDSQIYLCGTTFVTGSGTNDFVGIFGYGSIDDGITLSSFYGNSGQNVVSFGDPTITYEEVNGYKDLNKISKVEFPLTQNSATVTATYNYFVVPTDVTADPDNPEAYKNLVKVVPLMAFIMLVVAAAGMVYLKNKD